GDEVAECVLLSQQLPVLVPVAAHLATAAHVGYRDHHAAVQQGQAGGRERGVVRDLVGAVAVQVTGSGAVGGDLAAGRDRQRDRRPIGGARPFAPLDVQLRIEV